MRLGWGNARPIKETQPKQIAWSLLRRPARQFMLFYSSAAPFWQCHSLAGSDGNADITSFEPHYFNSQMHRVQNGNSLSLSQDSPHAGRHSHSTSAALISCITQRLPQQALQYRIAGAGLGVRQEVSHILSKVRRNKCRAQRPGCSRSILLIESKRKGFH